MERYWLILPQIVEQRNQGQLSAWTSEIELKSREIRKIARRFGATLNFRKSRNTRKRFQKTRSAFQLKFRSFHLANETAFSGWPRAGVVPEFRNLLDQFTRYTQILEICFRDISVPSDSLPVFLVEWKDLSNSVPRVVWDTNIALTSRKNYPQESVTWQVQNTGHRSRSQVIILQRQRILSNH